LRLPIPDIDLDDIQILFDNHPDYGLHYPGSIHSLSSGRDDKGSRYWIWLSSAELDPDFGVRQTRYESTPLHLAVEVTRDKDQKVPLARAFENITAYRMRMISSASS